ncbi:ABC transporter permease [Streptomyces sp. NPDC059008]|uniref:ABC transporter permease n=1 Tax=Streptomyces sp. NPDC059008 TaxID=3346693 RepID=UPI0036ADC72A
MTGTTAHLTAGGHGPGADGAGRGDGPGDPAGRRTAGGMAPLRGLPWLVWRQHRLVLGVLLAGSAAAAVWGAVLRGRMAGFIDAHQIAGCSLISLVPRCEGTQEAVGAFRAAYHPSLQLAELGLMLLPALIGVFLGAPLIARELEAGTHQLVLTQSVGPLRWLAAKLALPALVVLTATSGLSAVFAWLWRVGGDEVSGSYWYSTLGFHSLGPIPVAYALLGLAAGTLAGLLLRRTVASMALTLAAMIVLQSAFTLLRPHLMPSTTLSFGRDAAVQAPDDSWVLGEGYTTRSGARLTAEDMGCRPDGDHGGCLREHEVTGRFLDQHPVGHHWPLAWIEAGLVLALAVALTALAFRVMRRRHG